MATSRYLWAVCHCADMGLLGGSSPEELTLEVLTFIWPRF